MHCGHCGSKLLKNGQCPGLCTPTERDTNVSKRQVPEQLNVSEIQDLTFNIENIPWQYEPTVGERNALENLRKMIVEYQQYLIDTNLKKGGK